MLSDLLICLRALFRRNAVECELDAELRFHFDQQVEKFVQSGLPFAEARCGARLTIGGADQIKKECRDDAIYTRVRHQPKLNYGRGDCDSKKPRVTPAVSVSMNSTRVPSTM